MTKELGNRRCEERGKAGCEEAVCFLDFVVAAREYTSTQQEEFNSESKGFHDLMVNTDILSPDKL